MVSEITPKILALRNSEAFAGKVALPIRIFSAFLFPLAALLYRFTHLITSWIPHEEEELFDSEDELRTLADLGADRGTLKDEERRMIKSVFDLDETAVREIMVPRIDIIGMEQTISLKSAIDIIRQNRFSKFPLFEESIDKIRGILYAKDLLPYINSDDYNGIKLATLMRKPFFVPETKQIDDLLKDFQERRENIAIVVDEFGGTAGLVTVEDIVEEVVGEIQDEFDEEERLLYPLDKGQWMVDAKTTINDLVDEIPMEFPEEREYDTLGGFIFEQFGDIPKVGDVTVYQNYSFKVKSLEENRILKIVLTKMENSDESR
jgi:CBS domain containing-hemolysin-like protein